MNPFNFFSNNKEESDLVEWLNADQYTITLRKHDLNDIRSLLSSIFQQPRLISLIPWDQVISNDEPRKVIQTIINEIDMEILDPNFDNEFNENYEKIKFVLNKKQIQVVSLIYNIFNDMKKVQRKESIYQYYVDYFNKVVLQIDGLEKDGKTGKPEWILELWAWADKLNIDPECLPRDAEELMLITEFSCLKPIYYLPKEIGNLTNLTNLALFDYGMSKLPDEIGNLTKLTNLDLSVSQITELPKSIGDLKNLTNLNLGGAVWLKRIPIEIENLTRLKNLDISACHSLQEMDNLAKLSNLTKLSLHFMNFTVLPEWIWDLTSLEELDLSSNNLNLLPPEIGTLMNLSVLNLSSNYLIELPEETGDLQHLTELNLENNPDLKITGNFIEVYKKLQDIGCNVILSKDKISLVYKLLTETISMPESSSKVIELYNGLSDYQLYLASLTISSDHKYIVSVRYDGTMIIWNLESGSKIQTFYDVALITVGGETSITISRDNRYIAYVSDDTNTIKLSDMQSGKTIRIFTAHSEIHSLAISNDSKFMVSGSEDGSIKLWDLQSGNEIRTFVTWFDGAITSLAISSDNKYIVSGSGSGNIKVWDLRNDSEDCIRKFYHRSWTDESRIKPLILSSDNRYIVSGCDDRETIMLWDLQSDGSERINEFHKNRYYDFCTYQDKLYIVTSNDNTFTLWQMKMESFKDKHFIETLKIFEKHENLSKVAISNDCKYMISGSGDHTYKLLDSESGKELYTISMFKNGDYITITPDGYFNTSSKEFALKYINMRISFSKGEEINDEVYYNRYYRPDIIQSRIK